MFRNSKQDNTSEKKKYAPVNLLTPEKIVRNHLVPISTAAILDRLVMHPIDNLITLKQKEPTKGALTLAKSAFKQHPSTLYAGLSWSLVSSIPIRLSIYSTYTITRDELIGRKVLTNYSAMLVAGGFSGLLETMLLCPSDANRTREVLGIKNVNKFDPRVFYRGFTPLLARTAVENTIALAGSDILLENIPTSISQYSWSSYITGTISGVISQVVAAPLDNLKTRMMVDYSNDRGLGEHLKGMWSEKVAFQSTGLKILRTGFGTGLILGTISLVKSFVGVENKDEPEVTSSICKIQMR